MAFPPISRATPSYATLFPASGIIQHPGLGQVRYSVQEVSDVPEQQVRDTLSLMGRYAAEDAVSAAIAADAARAQTSGDPIADTWNYLRRDGDRGMQFIRDEHASAPFADYEYSVPGRWHPIVELISRPELLAQSDSPQGDCDCFATYGAAHLLRYGVPCSFAVVATVPEDPQTYSHVYLVAYPQSGQYAGQRVPMDLSHGPYPGWEVRRVFRKDEWFLPAALGSLTTMAVIAAVAGACWYFGRRNGGML